MIARLALAHIPAEHITCTHGRGGWGGRGGWDDTVQRLRQLSLASPKIGQGNSFKGKDSHRFSISKRGIVLGGGPIVLHAFHTPA